MKLRLKFKKTGRLKYIGHLDLLNIFNRAIKSAKIPVDYSKGFNPHMLISFASPLSVGIESVSEYVDIEFLDTLDVSYTESNGKMSAVTKGSVFAADKYTESSGKMSAATAGSVFAAGKYTELITKMNERFPDDLEITNVYALETPYKRVASIVTRAEYTFSAISSSGEISDEMANSFLAQPSIEIMKKTKRKNEITDIRPDIFEFFKTADGNISAVLACGSFQNLKPALLIGAFCEFAKIETPIYKMRIVRTEIFGETSEAVVMPLSEAFVAY